MKRPKRNIILSGSVGEGKTSFLRSIADILMSKHEPFVGLIATSESRIESRDTYILNILPQNRRILLASREPIENAYLWNSWYFNPIAFAEGEKIVKEAISNKITVLLDEVGRLELEGKGWGSIMDELQRSGNQFIITARNKLADSIVDRWPGEWEVSPISDFQAPTIAEKIIRSSASS